MFPQLLTEAIKNHKYDGIVYPSTKFFDKSLDFGKGWHSKIFQANIAMFTHYNPYSVYDDELFKNFDPHVLPLKNVKANNAYELLGNLLKDAATLQAFFNKYVSPSEISSNFETLLIHLEKKIKTYQVLKIDGENYLDTYAGKVEAEYMKEYLKYVRIQAKKFYQNEYEKWEEDEGKKSLGI